jgi:hypothetical protein
MYSISHILLHCVAEITTDCIYFTFVNATLFSVDGVAVPFHLHMRVRRYEYMYSCYRKVQRMCIVFSYEICKSILFQNGLDVISIAF